MGPGFLVAAVGMLLLTQLEIGSSYPALILPAQLLLGLGMGTAFMPAMSLATHGVEPRDAGVASAMVNTSQQVGGAIGTALLNTIAASATTAYVTDRTPRWPPRTRSCCKLQAMVHGYTSAIWWAVGILVVAVRDRRDVHQRRTSSATAVNSGSGSGDADGVEDEVKVPVVAH